MVEKDLNPGRPSGRDYLFAGVGLLLLDPVVTGDEPFWLEAVVLSRLV
ncbi:hypothetical protein BRAS3843_120067 [Bradyrhizobium sp. STM 3843]|nr:hypothetical protein BRAS3843_120067 [Bradyrhizobium sp. STM 3843]